MGMKEDFNKFAQDSREFQGKMLEFAKNTSDRLDGMARKNDDLDRAISRHKEDWKAHGKGAVAGWIALLGGIWAFLKDLMK